MKPRLRQIYEIYEARETFKSSENKAKKAVELFDYIHSLDNEKLANEFTKWIDRQRCQYCW